MLIKWPLENIQWRHLCFLTGQGSGLNGKDQHNYENFDLKDIVINHHVMHSESALKMKKLWANFFMCGKHNAAKENFLLIHFPTKSRDSFAKKDLFFTAFMFREKSSLPAKKKDHLIFFKFVLKFLWPISSSSSSYGKTISPLTFVVEKK